MRSILTKKLMAVLLAVCMIAALMPVGVFAATEADPATGTADFTVDNGEAAINMLNQYKTGTEAEDSLWDSGTKTLTLKGIDFTTTAATAVKLPAGCHYRPPGRNIQYYPKRRCHSVDKR